MHAKRALLAVALLLAATSCRAARPSLVAGSALLDPGVSKQLAAHRAATLSDVSYQLRFRIPASRAEPVSGDATIRFALSERPADVVLDFRGDSTSVRDLIVNGRAVAARVFSGHIVVPAAALARGVNEVSLSFAAGDEALNRNDEFMYALFVPDRAATAFPSFDQPDIKARYTLALEIPLGWRALANGPELRADTTGNHVLLSFGETERIPTYLMAFAAGKFEVEEAVRDGRTLTMLHRETDSAKVARNREAIFDLHATALRWLEEYTQIPYPFGKFAFLAVPSFQFGGMEHPGAVWYRAASLFLDESATQNQYLGRASLIAHETAHMWFGDLVTMRWFNDVWMKEVFANLMAARIVEPSFPEVNHPLRFLLAHHPTAYGVDRTRGANPIRQELANLRQAGSLYGAIIYQKAPIVMRQLEQLVGEDAFRDGLREYLRRYSFGNASWAELIDILDARTPQDLANWSRVWVEEPGRPEISARWSSGVLTLHQRDPTPSRTLRWPQVVAVAVGSGDSIAQVTLSLTGDSASAPLPHTTRPRWLLPGVDGVSYGHFVLDTASQRALLAELPRLASPLHRAAALHALWESVLSGSLPALDFVNAIVRTIPAEREELLTQQQLGLLRSAFWRYLPDSTRRAIAPRIEGALWSALEAAEGASRKGAYWGAIVSISLSDSSLARLHRTWQRKEPPRGLPLSEQQYTSLAEELALRRLPDADAMLEAESRRITNPDRQARFAFVRPSLSRSPSVRDSVFDSLADVANRRRESWVLDALRNLSHPLHASQAEHYLAPGLALSEEIQRTGDIFFPLGWMNALLDGHQSGTAADAVVRYLEGTPGLHPGLRGKLLQAADDLFRAARIVNGWQPRG